MKQVVSTDIESARYVIEVDHTEWKFFKDEFPEAVYDEIRKKYVTLEDDFFDKSDLAQLIIEISNGEVFHLDNIHLSAEYSCYYNKKTGEYIGIMIPEKDR